MVITVCSDQYVKLYLYGVSVCNDAISKNQNQNNPRNGKLHPVPERSLVFRCARGFPSCVIIMVPVDSAPCTNLQILESAHDDSLTHSSLQQDTRHDTTSLLCCYLSVIAVALLWDH
jgi:hypothetical protein